MITLFRKPLLYSGDKKCKVVLSYDDSFWVFLVPSSVISFLSMESCVFSVWATQHLQILTLGGQEFDTICFCGRFFLNLHMLLLAFFCSPSKWVQLWNPAVINKHWNYCKYLVNKIWGFPAWSLFKIGENAVAEKPISKKEKSVY